MSRPARPASERFADKVEVSDGCWVWTGNLNPDGYGQFRIDPRGRSILAHRAAYELLVGPIDDALTIDHLCRNRACVNPDHLEAVTAGENTRRALATKTHCGRGHADPLHRGKLQRICRKCKAENQRRYLARLGAVA